MYYRTIYFVVSSAILLLNVDYFPNEVSKVRTETVAVPKSSGSTMTNGGLLLNY